MQDTDGYLDKEVAYDFSQKSERLFDDVRALAIGLGFRMTKKEKIATCEYKGVKGEHLVYRGRLSGQGIQDIPVKVARRKMTRQPHAVTLRHFTIRNESQADA